MKIINQSHEVLHADSNTRLIEIAARTCYKSESKSHPGSDINLCKKLISRKHEAMLEHGYLVAEVTEIVYKTLKHIGKYLVFSDLDNRYIVSGNIRAWRDIFRTMSGWACPITESVFDLFDLINITEPVLFEDLMGEYGPFSDNPLPRILSLQDLTDYEKTIHQRITVRFITDRGVSHEIVRHRTASFAQESTRYCRYAGDMEFIKPVFDWGLHDFDIWSNAMQHTETSYNQMIDMGLSPQEARSVLPNSLKTEIIVTANSWVWRHIFGLRIAKSAHPQIRELMIPLLEEFKDSYPLMFTDIRS